MRRADDPEWIPASVPGSVFNDLLNAGKIEDPFYRDNEDRAKEIASQDYLYERQVYADSSVLDCSRLVLTCEGLDTFAEISVNGRLAACTMNMFRTYEIDVKKYLHPGENSISILLRSPLRYIEEKDRENPVYHASGSMAGFPYIRKAHYMFGWDWGPQIPDAGIWRPIYIAGYDCARLDDVYITQEHKDGRVTLDVRVGLQKWADDALKIETRVQLPEGKETVSEIAAVNGENHLKAEIVNPRLWWPNGYGQQFLYQVKVLLKNDGGILEERSYTIGLRTLGVKRKKDAWGETFEFEVNGVSIFAMGADYIPEDNLLSRCTPQRTEGLIQSCAEANFNCIRVWGGGIYPDDYFFDLCDRYGLIVWQDLMFACAMYVMTDEFADNIKREAEDNIRRIRHHACLGMWCGNNELEWFWTGKFSNQPEEKKNDYIRQFEVLLPETARETDPNTFYWPSSPSSGGNFDDPNNENRGDVHHWDVWHDLKPFTEYRGYYFRFASEFGFQSFPCLRTVESFTLPQDRNIFSYVMEKHQKNDAANGKILYYISENFKYPRDFDSLLFASQALQGEAIKYGVEHWRRHRGRCMGTIYWQLNDCWPVASWSSIDYYGRWKALHYFAKRFYAPILLSACEDGTKVDLYVTNDTLDPIKGEVIWKLRKSSSSVITEGSINIGAGPLQARLCGQLDLGEFLNGPRDRMDSYLEYSLEAGRRRISSGTVLFVKPKHFEFLDPQLQWKAEEQEDRYILLLEAAAFAKYVELAIDKVDCRFSDNYFDISAGEVKRVEIKKESMSEPIPVEKLIESLKVRSLFDIA